MDLIMPILQDIVEGFWNIIVTIDPAVGIIGFIIAFVQISKVQKSSDEAKKAAETSIQLVSDRTTMFNIGSISSSLREIQTALRGGRYEAALIRLHATRLMLHRLRVRRGFTSDERKTEIQRIVVVFSKIENKLETKIQDQNSEFSIIKTNASISKITGMMSEWEEETTLPSGEQKYEKT